MDRQGFTLKQTAVGGDILLRISWNHLGAPGLMCVQYVRGGGGGKRGKEEGDSVHCGTILSTLGVSWLLLGVSRVHWGVLSICQ